MTKRKHSRILVAGFLALILCFPVAAVDHEEENAAIWETWLTWIDDLWTSLSEISSLDGTKEDPITSSDDGGVTTAGQDDSPGQDELGPMVDPIG